LNNGAAKHLFWGRYFLALLAGLLLAASFPKIGIASLAWIAPALIVVAALGQRGADTFRIGYIAGLGQWLATLYWLLLIPVAWYPILGWVALCAYLALYPAIWVWLVSRCCPLISTGLQPGEEGTVRTSPAASAASATTKEAVETAHATHPPANTGLKPGANESSAYRLQHGWIQRTLWALTGAAIWGALEMVRARLLGGFPWTPLGVSQYKLLPLIQVASVSGVYGVSFIVVWCSLSLLLAGMAIVRHPTTRSVWVSEIILPVTALVALLIWGDRQLAQPSPSTRELQVAFVQPSIPQTMIWNSKENAARFKQVLELTQKALTAKPANPESLRGKLLLWPEAALPSFDEASYTAITNLIRTHRIWMIFGADDVERRPDARGSDEFDYFNSAFLFNPDGQFVASYRKRHLVMFGEYVPLARWLPFLKNLTPIRGGFTPGKKPVQFVIGWWGERPREPGANGMVGSSGASPYLQIKISELICFEDIFPELARESVEDDTDFLLNLTNNGWFQESAAQWQHAATAIFRAIENGLPLLRCSNNGLTCWVDAHGRIREIFRDDAGSIYGAGVMTAQIPLLEPGQTRPSTFYHHHGDWFGWACVGIGVVALAATSWRSVTAKQRQ